jgi:glyoxylase-like metal-dependent hydrolase (beta-lactamase superfamily II)
MYKYLLLFAALFTSLGQSQAAEFVPKAELVIDNVFAIVGPIGGRTAANDALNANMGFVVTPQGVILIDSGASKLGAEKIAAAIAQVSTQPVRWVVNTGSQDHR